MGVGTKLEANVGSGDKSHLITSTPEHLLMLRKWRCLWLDLHSLFKG